MVKSQMWYLMWPVIDYLVKIGFQQNIIPLCIELHVSILLNKFERGQ